MPNVILTKGTHRFVKKAAKLLITPYYYDADDAKYYLGADTYDIYAIVGNTIEIKQADSDSDTVDNEFSPIPVIENFKLGRWTFRADCIDMQNVVLRQLFSARTGYSGDNAVEGAVAMPSDYKTIYCCIQIPFKNDNTATIMLPKVLLSSGVNIGNLRSGSSRNSIQGTPLLTEICIRNDANSVLEFRDMDSGTFTPRTPVVFVPKDRDFGVLHHKDTVSQNNAYTYFSMYKAGNIIGVDTEDGSIQTTI